MQNPTLFSSWTSKKWCPIIRESLEESNFSNIGIPRQSELYELHWNSALNMARLFDALKSCLNVFKWILKSEMKLKSLKP